jgi:hypothetical protein
VTAIKAINMPAMPLGRALLKTGSYMLLMKYLLSF